METKQKAKELFEAKFNCAQSVLAAHADQLGLDESTCRAAAACFGAGACRRGEMCGAVSGALLTIGLQRQSELGQDPAGKETAYRLGEEFMAAFEKEFGSVLCHELLGFRMANPDGPSKEQRQAVVRERCGGFVEGAVKLLQEIS